MRFIFVFLFALIISFNLNAQRLHIYLGFMGSQVKTEDLRSVSVSDYEAFPSAEGRLNLPLDRAKSKKLTVDQFSFSPGAVLGAEFYLLDWISVLVEAEGSKSGELLMFGGNLGTTLKFLDLSFIWLGVRPKIGGSYGLLDLGEAQLDTGYTPPVILGDGQIERFKNGERIENGDKLSSTIWGFRVGGGLALGFRFGSLIGLTIDAGYIKGFAGDFKLKVERKNATGSQAKEFTLKGTDSAIVELNGSRSAAKLKAPETTGLYISVSVSAWLL